MCYPPKLNFCWICSKPLTNLKGHIHRTIDGEDRIVHGNCGNSTEFLYLPILDHGPDKEIGLEAHLNNVMHNAMEGVTE